MSHQYAAHSNASHVVEFRRDVRLSLRLSVGYTQSVKHRREFHDQPSRPRESQVTGIPHQRFPVGDRFTITAANRAGISAANLGREKMGDTVIHARAVPETAP